jgi:hypothetical protein
LADFDWNTFTLYWFTICTIGRRLEGLIKEFWITFGGIGGKWTVLAKSWERNWPNCIKSELNWPCEIDWVEANKRRDASRGEGL